MTIFKMLEQSGNLTLLGMGTVFGFLALMILAVTITGKVIHALHLDKDLDAPAAGLPVSRGASTGAAVTAAITAAINEYQKGENR